MPFYDYQCLTCGNKIEIMHPMSELDNTPYLESKFPKCCDCVKYTLVVGSPSFIWPEKMGRVKAPSDFRNLLSKIKKNNPGSTIKDR